MTKASFKATDEEFELSLKIARRMRKIVGELDTKKAAKEFSVQAAMMDILACNANGTPIDMQRLLEADDFNFVHDAFGISKYIDRETGKITDCFLPRCSR